LYRCLACDWVKAKTCPFNKNAIFIFSVVSCPPFPWPQHGRVTCPPGDIIYGATCDLSCDDGYHLPDSESNVTCLETGFGDKDTASISCQRTLNHNMNSSLCFHLDNKYSLICYIAAPLMYIEHSSFTNNVDLIHVVHSL